MKITDHHSWEVTPGEARLLQKQLRPCVVTSVCLPMWKTLAAADVSFDRGGTQISAAVVVVKRGTLEVVERVGVVDPMRFPYVPGLLAFREIPALLKAFERLTSTPDLVLCDGQGIAHPQRMGIASHLGLILNLPTVGCAKSRLYGTFAEPGPHRGDRSDLLSGTDVIGTVLRTRANVAPLFVSPGHLCDLASAVDLVLETTSRYRLPIPSRMAHNFVNEVRRAAKLGLPIPS